MTLIEEYIEFNGKHPKGFVKPEPGQIKREYYPEPNPHWKSYGCSYGSEFLKVDIDDYDHKTGELNEPIKGGPRSDAIVALLDDLNIKYNGIKTEHGKHLFFRKPETLEAKNIQNWYSPLAVLMEWKFPTSDDHIPLQINGVKREFFKGSLDNADVDELPFFLYPLQKGKTNPCNLEFRSGDRTQKLGGYLFRLVEKKGYSAEQAIRVVELMNKYVFTNSIPDEELYPQILNEHTIEKLRNLEKTSNTSIPDKFKQMLAGFGINIRYNALLNVVEFDGIPPTSYFDGIHDEQNQMPTALQYAFREFSKNKSISYDQTVKLISLEADKNSYNPVQDYLTGTEWDRVNRFPALFDCLGVSDELEQSLIRKWFFQTAALPFNSLKNPIQPEGVLILQGKEGIGKTRFFNRMGVSPLWFKSLDKPMSTKNKDTLIETLSAWITEIGEIDRTFREKRSDLKSFMTADKDSIRKPYAREAVTSPRTTSICGTTNKEEFLNEETGFRRWWVIHIPGRINVEEFIQADNLAQFWAQCYAETVKDLECFRLTEDEAAQLEKRNKSVMELLPAEDELRLRFDFNAPESEWIWAQSAAIKNIPGYDVANYSPILIGKALSRISEDFPKIYKKKQNDGYYKWFIPPFINGTDQYRNHG